MTRVVQMEPGPTPTFTALTPASIKSLGAMFGDDIAGHDREVAVGFFQLAGPLP